MTSESSALGRCKRSLTYILLHLVCLTTLRPSLISAQSEVILIDSGAFQTCALFDNGQVKCWGSGGLGQPDVISIGGLPGQMGDNLPFIDLGTGTSALHIAAGGRHTCALLDTYQVKCWGNGLNGQLGYGAVETRGQFADDMGDSLPVVDLGSGLSALQVVTGFEHTCVLLNNSKVKCWGKGTNGQLGYGDTLDRGDSPLRVGDNLPFVDLGTDEEVIQLSAGKTHNCALLKNTKVKCWGDSSFGQLGNGDRESRGDEFGEMGTNLSFVDFGDNASIASITTGPSLTCGIFTNGLVKCFGSGFRGALGTGEEQDVGAVPGQMGNLLPFVDFGENLTALDVTAGTFFTCVLVDDERVKCFGRGDLGSLGYGDVQSRGDDPGEMGDVLPFVDLGLNVSVEQISSGNTHTCARLSNRKVKCWGDASSGQLGYGNEDNLGDGPGEMGNNLSFVDLGENLPTSAPTPSTTVSLAWIDTIGVLGNGAAVAIGTLLTIGARTLFSKRSNSLDCLFIAGFVAAAANAASGVALVQANSRSFFRVSDLTVTLPILLRCLLAAGLLVQLQYASFLEKHWNWNNYIVKLVISNMEALDLLFVMTPIMNSLVYVELRVNDFELYGVSLIYVALWLLRKIHHARVFKGKAQTPESRSNIVYRTISQSSLPLNAVVLIASVIPLSIYLAVHLIGGWRVEARPPQMVRTKAESSSFLVVKSEEVGGDHKENGDKDYANRPTVSRVELLAYLASISIDIFLVIDLSSAVIGNTSAADVEIFLNNISFSFAICLLGLDIATLKSYFTAPETLETIEQENGLLSRTYLIYVATTRVEAYLLLCLLGILAANAAEALVDPTGLIFVVTDYIIVNVRLWLRVTSTVQVKAFDIEKLGRIENFFPVNVVVYGAISAVDIVFGLIKIPAILYGSYQVFAYGRWLPKANLQSFLELASTHAY